MALENGLYPKVVMICRRGAYDKKEQDKTKQHNFQVQSERTKHSFNIDHEWLKGNFMTCEPDFYVKIYQTKFRCGDKRIYQIFGVPIGNGKLAKSTVPTRSTTYTISSKFI